MNKATFVAAAFRDFSARILNNPNDREAIAGGFTLIAEAIEEAEALVNQSGIMGCADCGAPVASDELPDPVLVPDLLPAIAAVDLPDAGADLDSTVTQGA